MNNSPSDNEMIGFLETIVSELKNQTISLENYRQLLDFFLKYKFQILTEGKIEDDWIKNYTMGWYIYNFCIKNNIDSNK